MTVAGEGHVASTWRWQGLASRAMTHVTHTCVCACVSTCQRLAVCVCVCVWVRNAACCRPLSSRGHRAPLETSGTIPSGYNGPLVPRIVPGATLYARRPVDPPSYTRTHRLPRTGDVCICVHTGCLVFQQFSTADDCWKKPCTRLMCAVV